jgi:hypothetical protein
MSISKDEQVLLAVIIGVVFIMAIVVAVLLFAPLSPFSMEDQGEVNVQGEVNDLELSVRADMSHVDVVFQTMPDHQVYVTFYAEGSRSLTVGDPDMDLDVTGSVQGTTLMVQVNLEQEIGPGIDYREKRLTVYLDPDLPVSMDIEVGVGNLEMITPEGTVIEGLTLQCGVGSMDLEMVEGTVLNGSLSLRTDVGSVSLRAEEVVLGSEVLLDVVTKVGSVDMVFRQSVDMGHDLSVDCSVNVGSVDLTLEIEGEIGAEITSSADVGNVNVESTGFSGEDVHLTSDNFPGMSALRFVLTTEVGSVNVEAVWNA